MLTTQYTRPVFKSILLDVKDAFIDTKDLEWSESEALLKLDGFRACRFVRHLDNYRYLQSLDCLPLLELMKQFSPIFWVFGMISCEQLYRSNAKERYKELCYEEDKPKGNSQLPNLTPTSATKLVEGVRLSEWRNFIRKKLMESRKIF